MANDLLNGSVAASQTVEMKKRQLSAWINGKA
jgi:hypothetical protein